MDHIRLESQDEAVRRFVLSLKLASIDRKYAGTLSAQ
jgi:hypothetical protein